MKIIRKEDAQVRTGTTFTGPAQLEEMVTSSQKDGVRLTVVRFEDGARTNWHIHPGEQILYILEGEGRVGTETIEATLKPGDAVYAPPGEKHWHGAAEGSTMAHISVTTGGSPQWLEAPE
jgi:quercetin dioxygenase-like cupin family protein